MLYMWQMITSFNSAQGKKILSFYLSSLSEEKKNSLELISSWGKQTVFVDPMEAEKQDRAQN